MCMAVLLLMHGCASAPKKDTAMSMAQLRNSYEELLSAPEDNEKGDRIIVEGRLQNNTVKNEDGSEKRIVELDAFAIERLAGDSAGVPAAQNSPDTLVQFGQTDFSDDLIGEDEIPF